MDNTILALANAIYGEAASEDIDTMKMVGSVALNRLEAGKIDEFGSSMPEVLQKGFYAVSNPNEPYKQAISGQFPDKLSETKYKQALSIASGLVRGTIDRSKGQFYFTDNEVKKLKGKGKKSFNFDVVKPTGKVGKYNTYSY